MSDPTTPDPRGADARWFRSHVDPVVDAVPIPDAWHAIEARTQGDAPAAAAPTGRGSRRWLAIAAVLALLAGLAVVVAGTQPDDSTTVTANEPDATGWYIPTDLPDGWTLRTAWVTKRPTACGDNSRRWEGTPVNGITPRLELTYTPCGSDVTLEGEAGPALGHGVDETVIQPLSTDPPATQLLWKQAGSWSLLATGGLTRDDLVEAAKVIVTRPASVASPLEGLAGSGASFSNGPLPGPTVAVSLQTPTGQIASYRLGVPGTVPAVTPFQADEPVAVPGQPLPVELRTPRYDDQPTGLENMGDHGGRSASSYLGTWPSADLQVPRSNFTSDAAGKEPTNDAEWEAYDASLLQLVGSLRPATAGEWRAFLTTATDRPAARLFTADDLAEATGHRSSEATATTTTTAIAPASTSEPDDGGRSYQGNAYPATPVPRADTDDRLTPLDDLEITMELENLHGRAEGPELAVGEVAPAKLIVHNTSAAPVVLTECTLAFTRWGLLPADDPGATLPEITGGCSAFPEETVPAGGTIRLPIDWRRPAGFVAQRPAADGSGRYLGPLPQGAYLATVDVPGRTSDVRLQLGVDVGEPPCPASDEDVADYLGLPRSRAQALATERGLTLRMATLDGEPIATPDDVRCDRVQVDVWLSEVVNAYVT